MMAHLLPSMALLLIAAMVLVTPAASSGWVHNQSCKPHPKYVKLGEFAVNRYNKQNHGHLKFWNVKDCWVLDCGTGHYMYCFLTIVDGGKEYKTEVLEDLSALCHPPVHNFGYFTPVAAPPPETEAGGLAGAMAPLGSVLAPSLAPQPPKWQPNPTCQPHGKYERLGEFAVKRYNEQHHGKLKFWAVKDCSVLDRGTGHYTYRFITIVRGGRKYNTEVLEDLSAPGHPPVHNFGDFYPKP